MPSGKRIRVLYTGGGTGGHRVPLLAVHQALCKVRPVEGFYIGEEADVASPEIIALGVPTATIKAGKLRRYLHWRNLTDVGRVWHGYRTSLRLLKEWRPDIVLAKGGYVSVPVAAAAARLKIPVVAHESDIVMGLANRLVARWAAVVCTTFPVDQYPLALRPKLLETGQPIREELVRAARYSVKGATVDGQTLDPEVPLLLVLGGSQGARRLNELLSPLLERLTAEVQVVHQTGERGFAAQVQLRSQLPAKRQGRYLPLPYLSADLPGVLRQAAVVVSRAGSMTTEIALFGPKLVLVPLSSGAGGHQLANAAYWSAHKAAIVVDEEKATAESFWRRLSPLWRSQSGAETAENLHRLARPAGAAKVAEVILAHV